MEEAGKRRGVSLYFVLWLIFSVFALLLVGGMMAVMSVFVRDRYVDGAKTRLRTAGSAATAEIQRDGEVYPIFYEQGIGAAYLVCAGDRSVLTYLGEERTFPDFTEYAEAEGDTFLVEGGDELVWGTEVVLEGRPCTLYLFVSLEPLNVFATGFKNVTLVTALIAAVLACVVSLFLARIVAGPVAEVAAQAKAIACGDYSLAIRKNYCFAEIRDLAGSLDSARREISKAERIQRELIANVSHDFKTPLTTIKAYASMIREISGEDREKREAHAAIIEAEADRLAALVADLLDLSRLRAGAEDTEGKRTVFDLSEEVRETADRFAALGEEQGYRFEICVEDGLYTNASRLRVGQVLYNLIGNAVNYTGDDKRVRVKLFQKEKSARFEVIDSGKGIPKDELDDIWDRYYRSSQTHKRPVQGTGLGLSIVKSILLAYGAPFGVISEEGKGSCFWVEFPLAENEREGEEK